LHLYFLFEAQLTRSSRFDERIVRKQILSSHTQNGAGISEHVWGKFAETKIKFMV